MTPSYKYSRFDNLPAGPGARTQTDRLVEESPYTHPYKESGAQGGKFAKRAVAKEEEESLKEPESGTSENAKTSLRAFTHDRVEEGPESLPGMATAGRRDEKYVSTQHGEVSVRSSSTPAGEQRNFTFQALILIQDLIQRFFSSIAYETMGQKDLAFQLLLMMYHPD